MTMCDKELLVGYLYDEVEAAERRTMESHLLACAECRGELKDLRGTRTRLAAWAPPTPELEFQMVRAPEAAASRARPWSTRVSGPNWRLSPSGFATSSPVEMEPGLC